jgi:hypothetical protein
MQTVKEVQCAYCSNSRPYKALVRAAWICPHTSAPMVRARTLNRPYVNMEYRLSRLVQDAKQCRLCVEKWQRVLVCAVRGRGSSLALKIETFVWGAENVEEVLSYGLC